MTLALRYVAHSEIGLVRKNNQDSGYASPNLLMVADGMGGAAAGDLASAVAIANVRTVDQRVTGEAMLELLSGAILRANDQIADLVADDHSLEGMGTTVSAALFDGSQLGLAHIGDSRVYLLRNSNLERLTHDHSWVQFLVDDGKITEEEAAYHPHRSLLLKVLNGQPSNDPDVSLVPVHPGDRLLFCSDGLCGLLDDPKIKSLLSAADSSDALHELAAEALRQGGIDNITIIVADVVEVPDDLAGEGLVADDLAGEGVLADHPAGKDATGEALVLGAATEREIPDVAVRSQVIDPGDDHDDEADSEGSAARRPAAPAPEGAEAEPPTSPSAEGDDDHEEHRYAPRQPPSRRRRLIRPLITIVVVLAVLAGLGGAGYAWSRTQYYVGAADEQVAIFRGLPGGLPGVPFSTVYERQPVLLRDLPSAYQQRVQDTMSARNLAAARASVAELADIAHQCKEQRRPKPSATPAPPKSSKPVKPPATSKKPPQTKTPKSPASSTSAPDAKQSPSPSGTPTPDQSC